MILSFRDKRTRIFYEGERVKAFQGFERQAMLRLDRLDAADRHPIILYVIRPASNCNPFCLKGPLLSSLYLDQLRSCPLPSSCSAPDRAPCPSFHAPPFTANPFPWLMSCLLVFLMLPFPFSDRARYGLLTRG
jgi:hypothetical protein